MENLEPMPDGHASYLVLGSRMSVTNQNKMGRNSRKWCLKNDPINALIAGRTLESTEDAIDVSMRFLYCRPQLHVQRGPCACRHPGDPTLQKCGLVLSEALDYADRSELHQANQTCYPLHSHIFTRRYPGDVLIRKH